MSIVNIKGKNKKLEKMKQKLFALKETVMTNITNKEDFKIGKKNHNSRNDKVMGTRI